MSLSSGPALPSQAPPSQAPAGRTFLFGYAVAQVGAFLSFLPLFQILLPLKAEHISGARHVAVLSVISSIGAVAGGIANLAAAWLSDRTRSKFGRRRPWILLGLLGVVTSYGLIWLSRGPVALTAAVVVFQVAFNILFAPLVSLTPDRVSTAQRGWVAGLLALGQPLALIAGGLVIGDLVLGEAARYAALALMVALAIGPFALTLHDPGLGARIGDPSPERAPGVAVSVPSGARNFWLGWVARAFAVAALSGAQTYLLFFLQDGLHFTAAGLGPISRGVGRLAIVFGVVSVAGALGSGWISDRLGRRRSLVICGALLMAGGLAMVAFTRDWIVLQAAYAVFGLGAGCHTAVDFALMTELLPSRDRPARDLAILNVSNIIPQVVAPIVATALMSLPGGSIRSIYAAGALCAALAAVTVGLMRGVR